MIFKLISDIKGVEYVFCDGYGHVEHKGLAVRSQTHHRIQKSTLGAKMGKMKGKPILFECLLRKLGENYDKKFQYQTTFF